MKAKRRNPAVSTWGSSGYIVVLPKGEVMADETSKAPSGTTSRWGAAIDKFNAAVAAPLEGTSVNTFFRKGLAWHEKKLLPWQENVLIVAEAYAAAVSKASREELANEIAKKERLAKAGRIKSGKLLKRTRYASSRY